MKTLSDLEPGVRVLVEKLDHLGANWDATRTEAADLLRKKTGKTGNNNWLAEAVGYRKQRGPDQRILSTQRVLSTKASSSTTEHGSYTPLGHEEYLAAVKLADTWPNAEFYWTPDRGEEYPKCAYCRLTPEDPRSLQWEHILPSSRGGPDLSYNLVLACQPCNGSKGSQLPLEWWRSLERRYLHRDIDQDPPLKDNQLRALWNLPTLLSLETVALRCMSMSIWSHRGWMWLKDRNQAVDWGPF